MKSIKKYTQDELIRMRAKYDYTIMLNPPPFTKTQLDVELERRKLNKKKCATFQTSIPFNRV